MPVIWSLGNCVPMAKLFKSELHQICYLPWSNLCNLFLDERVSPRVFFGKTRTFSLRSVRIVRNLSQQRWVDSTINVKVRKRWGGGVSFLTDPGGNLGQWPIWMAFVIAAYHYLWLRSNRGEEQNILYILYNKIYYICINIAKLLHTKQTE